MGSRAAPAAAPAQPLVLKPQNNRALAEQYLQRGINHYDAQEVDQALAAYQQCVQADSTFAIGHNSLGMVLIDLERYDEALQALYQSVRCDANYAEAYNNLGFVLRRMQRPLDAVASYTRFLLLEPDVEEGPRIQGWMDTVLQEHTLTQAPPLSIPAMTTADPAPEAAPAEPPKLKKMAAWEAAAGDTATAAPVSALGEVGSAPAHAGFLKPAPAPAPAPVAPAPPAKAAPQAPPPAQKAPLTPMKVGGMKTAPAPSAAPAPGAIAAGDATPYIEKGMDQFEQGELDNAVKWFEQAIEADATNCEGHIGLAKVWIRQEKMNEAIERLQKAVRMDPQEPAGLYVLGYALRAVERNIEAAEAYESYLNMMPDALDSAKMRQWIQHITGVGAAQAEPEEIVADEEQIVTPVDHQYKAALGKFQDGEMDASLRDCITALNEDPGHVRTRVLLGRVYMRQKQFDNAIEQFEAALVTRPDYPESLYFLGQVAEKKGANDKAASSFKRYIEVAPNGPRAEKIKDWIVTHDSAPPSSGNQAQCELCLRFFPEHEMTPHEGRATCRNCMTVMGGTPEAGSTDVAATAVAVSGNDAAPGKGGVKFTRAGPIAAIVVVALLAGLFFAKTHVAAFITGLFGGTKATPKVVAGPNVTIEKQPVPLDMFDPAGVKITNEPSSKLQPLARWSYTPVIEGLDKLDALERGWKKEFFLKNEPRGMTVDPATGQVNFTPEPGDYDSLKRGEVYKVELVVKGTKSADGTTRELFSVSKPINLGCQFGYDLGPELDLKLSKDDRVVVAAGDLTGDDLADTVVATGSFREGNLRLYVQRKNAPLPAPTELAGKTQFSALHVGDLDGDKLSEILATDWLGGKLKLFYRKQQEISTDVPEVVIGAGPVALSVLPKPDKSAVVAVLLGAGNALAVTTVSVDRKFSDPVKIPLSGNGGRGYVLPWNSAASGTGFLAVLPLAAAPLQFVPRNGDKWADPVASKIDDGDLITAAAVLTDGAGRSRLALLVSGKANRLLLYEEKGGTFSPVGSPLSLLSIGAGLLSRDFNADGQDDLFVVTLEESQFYFAQGTDLMPGPRFVTKTPRMMGPISVFSSDNAERPDLILINEHRKAQILKAVISDPLASPEFEVKFSRPLKVGTRYQLTAEAAFTTRTKSGAAAATEAASAVDLDCAVDVLEVNEQGWPKKASVNILKLVRTTGDKKSEVISSGKIMFAETGKAATEFKFADGSEIPVETHALLHQLLPDVVGNGESSRAYEPKTGQKAGEEWAVDAPSAVAALARNGTTAKPEDVTGNAKFAALKKVNAIDHLDVSVEQEIKNATISTPPNSKIDSSEMSIRTTWLLPLEATFRPAETSVMKEKYSYSIGPNKTETERERTIQIKRTPPK